MKNLKSIIVFGSFLPFSCAQNDFKAGSPKPQIQVEAADLGKDINDDDDELDMQKGDDVVVPPPVVPIDDKGITPGTPSVIDTNCQFKAPRTGLTKNGFVVFLEDAYKPGVFGTPTATEGLIWANGGTNKKYGTAPSTLDWNLCPKLAFHERGHSVTRTINFSVPAKDGNYELLIHRVRFSHENDGVGIWYHWDNRVTWKAKPLHKFVRLMDYHVKCAYTASTNKFLCEHTSSTLTSVDCAARKVKRPRLDCNPMEMAP